MMSVLQGTLTLAIGAALGAVFRQVPVAAVLDTSAGLAVRAVPVFVFPMVFFGLVARSRELALSRALHTYAWLLAGQACVTVALAALGILSVLATSPNRIPIIIVEHL